MNKLSGKCRYSQGATAEKAEPPRFNFFQPINHHNIFREASKALKEV